MGSLKWPHVQMYVDKIRKSVLLPYPYPRTLTPEGRRRALDAARGRKPLQSPTEVGHVLQLLIVWEEETSDLKPGTRLFQTVWTWFSLLTDSMPFHHVIQSRFPNEHTFTERFSSG
ncbi:hypothetical protein ACRRTK_021964 [Alexandromys fortis]